MNQFELTKVIRAPVVSEKSTVLADTENRFVFKVQKNATKREIKKAVEILFEVEVDSVQVLNVIGKKKRFGRTLGIRSDWKKAYVKLKPGFDIEFSAA